MNGNCSVFPDRRKRHRVRQPLHGVQVQHVQLLRLVHTPAIVTDPPHHEHLLLEQRAGTVLPWRLHVLYREPGVGLHIVAIHRRHWGAVNVRRQLTPAADDVDQVSETKHGVVSTRAQHGGTLCPAVRVRMIAPHVVSHILHLILSASRDIQLSPEAGPSKFTAYIRKGRHGRPDPSPGVVDLTGSQVLGVVHLATHSVQQTVHSTKVEAAPLLSHRGQAAPLSWRGVEAETVGMGDLHKVLVTVPPNHVDHVVQHSQPETCLTHVRNVSVEQSGAWILIKVENAVAGPSLWQLVVPSSQQHCLKVTSSVDQPRHSVHLCPRTTQQHGLQRRARRHQLLCHRWSQQLLDVHLTQVIHLDQSHKGRNGGGALLQIMTDPGEEGSGHLHLSTVHWEVGAQDVLQLLLAEWEEVRCAGEGGPVLTHEAVYLTLKLGQTVQVSQSLHLHTVA